MTYFDGSYIIKCYLNEPGTTEVLALASRSEGRSSAIHARAEFWSGVHRHVREKHLSLNEARAVWRQFERDERSGLWHWLLLSDSVIRRACDVFEKLDSKIFLRTGDALHLACASENGFADIYSNDRILLAAAGQFGLNGMSVY